MSQKSRLSDKLETVLIRLEEIAAFTTENNIRKLALETIEEIEEDLEDTEEDDEYYYGP